MMIIWILLGLECADNYKNSCDLRWLTAVLTLVLKKAGLSFLF